MIGRFVMHELPLLEIYYNVVSEETLSAAYKCTNSLCFVRASDESVAGGPAFSTLSLVGMVVATPQSSSILQ